MLQGPACLPPMRKKRRTTTIPETPPVAEPKTESPSLNATVTPPPGNSEAIAKDLAATYQIILNNPDTKTYFSEVVCDELNKFKKLKLAEEVWCNPPVPGNNSVKHGLLVEASTTGNGDAPETSDKFQFFLLPCGGLFKLLMITSMVLCWYCL